MAKVLSSISGNLISAASAAYAPTNGADVSAIASAYASGKQDSSAMSAYALSSDVSGVIDTVSGNSASWGGGATGDYVEKSSTQVAIGSSVSATGNASFAEGIECSAGAYSFAQGHNNSAGLVCFAAGDNNTANFYSVALLADNTANNTAVCIGSGCYASQGSVSIGRKNSTWSASHTLGSGNSASGFGIAVGYSNSAKNNSFAAGKGGLAVNSATAFGTYNLHTDGDTTTGQSAAFVIGDGTATGARHDLMLVTKNGEITMYSSTADTTGTGVMSSIRAMSADVSGVIDTVSSNSASWGGGGGGGIDSATCSAIASAYAESAVSGVEYTVSGNSAIWASTIATASATAYKQSGTQLVTFTGVASADSMPLIAQTIKAGAVQNLGGLTNFFYGPTAKPFTANTAGIYSPLQYATGACLAMDGGTYRAYYKGNEWFVSDYSNGRSGAVRAEVHSTRGIHISGSNTAGVGFDLLTTGLNFTNNTGTTSMTPANIAEWQSCNSTVSTNSATWGETAYIPLSSTSIEMTSTAYSASYNLESIDLFVKDANSSNVLIEPDGISFKSGNGTNIGFVDPYHIGNWDGVYNTVSTQSANWGGYNETVLWTGSLGATNSSQSLSESIYNFNAIEVHCWPNKNLTTQRGPQVSKFTLPTTTSTNFFYCKTQNLEAGTYYSELIYVNVSNGTSFQLAQGHRWQDNTQTKYIDDYRGSVCKIVGINRIASN